MNVSFERERTVPETTVDDEARGRPLPDVEEEMMMERDMLEGDKTNGPPIRVMTTAPASGMEEAEGRTWVMDGSGGM